MPTRVINIKSDEKYDVYCGRPGPFGNPFQSGSRDTNIENYRRMFLERVKVDERFKRAVLVLKGKTLGCFCRPVTGFKGTVLCHVQIIAGWVDGIPPEEVA